jgi:hypothetical protein
MSMTTTELWRLSMLILRVANIRRVRIRIQSLFGASHKTRRRRAQALRKEEREERSMRVRGLERRISTTS